MLIVGRAAYVRYLAQAGGLLRLVLARLQRLGSFQMQRRKP